MGKKEGLKEKRKGEGEGEDNLKTPDSQDGGGTEWESKERDTLIEEAIVALERNLSLEKFPGIHKDDPS